MRHNQGALLQPSLDEPFDRGRLFAEAIGGHKPVSRLRHKKRRQIMPSLGIIVGVARLWRHNHSCAVLRARLIGILLPRAGGVMVGYNHNVLCGAELLANCATHGNQIRGRISDDAWAPGDFVDRRGGGEAFRDVDGSRIIVRANLPEAPARNSVRMVQLPAIVRDVLQTRKLALGAVKRDNQSPVACHARPMRLDALAREIRMIGAGVRRVRPNLFDGVGGHLPRPSRFGVPDRLGFCKAAGVRHFLDLRQRPPDLRAPVALQPSPPAPELSCGDPVREENIPACFVPVARLALRSRPKAMQLAVDQDGMGRGDSSRLHGVGYLMLQRWRFILGRESKRPSKNANKISHLASPCPLGIR